MTLKHTIIVVLFSVCFSCKKDNPVGPPIESYFGELSIFETFSHDKPVGVDFSAGEAVNFSAEFSVQADYTLDISGRTSGANYSVNQTGQNLENISWLGNSNSVFFKQYEWCDVALSFNGYDTLLTDSVLILGVQDFSNLGLLLTSFEDASEFSIVNGQETVTNGIVSNASSSVHGTNHLEIKGEGSGTYFGATRFQFDPGTITEQDVDQIYFNGFFKSSYSGSTVGVKLFEDHNNNNQYDQGVDEAWVLKFPIQDDGEWHKLSFNLSDLIVDVFAGNVEVDGILNTNNIIRIDVISSQQGNVFGTFGFFSDYYILTYNSAL
jgi:hypothetical protein